MPRIAEQPPAVRRNLRLILADAIVFTLMVGLAESYFPAFALALGMSEAAAGLIATLPMLIGSLLQLVSPYGVQWVGTHRRWVVCSVSMQSLSFMPLAGTALLGRMPGWVVFAMISLYWAGGLGSAGAWSTWIGRLVPPDIRAKYFAYRTRFLQLGTLVGLAAAGAALHYVSEARYKLLAFAAVFAAAGLCRAASATCLWMHGEAEIDLSRQRHVSAGELARRLWSGGNARLLAFMLVMQVCSQIGTPFFSPYLLRELRLPYASFMVLIAASFVGRAAALPLLGRFAHRHGVMKLLWLGAAAITPAAALWTVSPSVEYLILAQLASGAAWAAYELATILLYFEAIPEDERTSVVTTFNVANAAAMTLGSLAGAGLLGVLGANRQAYFALFWISTLGRALTLVMLRRFSAMPAAAAAAGREVDSEFSR